MIIKRLHCKKLHFLWEKCGKIKNLCYNEAGLIKNRKTEEKLWQN